jgi:hypothetical protein
LLFPDGVEDIAGTGNLGKIDLGLDLVAFGATGARRLCRGRSFGRVGAEVGPHLDGLVIFNGTGMGLLLGDPDFSKNVENRLALDFQFPGQIVDSNLAHPPRFLRTIPLSLHINLTVSV